ncbi:unnamed protein product [Ostreobium quekettii]|uniref:Uncharacterized protein n=1 Tax=Ostreobium quekettii TaxID=121088 RepID=A0A8S1JB87_9CHLO|nr:unnamed protein product [Ostreobium quekettii]|eukprot:evm.model.scf_196.1 EVM.evm.TU.scf_196.1   scf_196:8077-10534(+)
MEEARDPRKGMTLSRSPGMGRSRSRTPDGTRARQSWIVTKAQGRHAFPSETRGQQGDRDSRRPRSRSGDRRGASSRRRSTERRQPPELAVDRLTKSTSAWLGCQEQEDLEMVGMCGRRPGHRVPHSRRAAGGRDGAVRVNKGMQEAESDEASPGRHIHDSVGSIVQKGGGSGCQREGYFSDEYTSPKLAAHPRGGSFYIPDSRAGRGAGKSGDAGGETDRSRDGEVESDCNELSFKPGRESSGSPDMFCPTPRRNPGRARGYVGRSPEQDGSDWGCDSRCGWADPQLSAKPRRRAEGGMREEGGKYGAGLSPVKSGPDMVRRSVGDRPTPRGDRSPSPFDVMKTAPEMHVSSSLMGTQEILRTNDLMRTADLRWDFLQSTDVCWDLNSRDAERLTPGAQGRWTESGRPGVRHRSPSTGAQPVTPHNLPRMPSKDKKQKGGFISKLLAGCCRPESVMYDAPARAQVPQQRRPSFFAHRQPTEREATLQRFATRQKFMVNLIEEERFNPNGSARQQ